MEIIIEDKDKLLAKHNAGGHGTISFTPCGLFHSKWKIHEIRETFLINRNEAFVKSCCLKNGYDLVIERPLNYDSSPTAPPKYSYDNAFKNYHIKVCISIDIEQKGLAFYQRNRNENVIDSIMDIVYKQIAATIHKNSTYTIFHILITFKSVSINDDRWDHCDDCILFQNIGISCLTNINECSGLAMIIHKKFVPYLDINYSGEFNTLLVSIELLLSYELQFEGIVLKYELKRPVIPKSYTQWK